MPRPKIKNGKKKIYYLDEQTIEEISRCAGVHSMSDSSYIDFIIKREKLNQNPVLQIKEIQNKKEELQIKINELERQEKVAVESATKIHEWQQAKRIKKPQAIKLIGQKILARDFETAEEIAKTWSRMTGIPALELILEAKEKVEVSGI